MIGLSGFWILGVPAMMRMRGNKNKNVSHLKFALIFKWDDYPFWFNYNLINFTFKAFVQAASSLVELIIVRSAIEHPLKRTIVAELQTELQHTLHFVRSFGHEDLLTYMNIIRPHFESLVNYFIKWILTKSAQQNF